jgi:hypothetical protein
MPPAFDAMTHLRLWIASVTLISYPSRVETPSDPEGIARALIKFYSSDKLKASRNEMTANDVDHVRDEVPHARIAGRQVAL